MKVKNKQIIILKVDKSAAIFSEFDRFLSIPFSADELKVKNVYFLDNGSTHTGSHVILCRTSLPLAYNNDFFNFQIVQNNTSYEYIDQEFQIKNNASGLNFPINGTYKFQFIKADDETVAQLRGTIIINLEFIEYEKE